MGFFDQATAVRSAGDGVFRAELDAQWTVGGKFHGGYLLALLARAAADAAGERHGDLSAVSAVFVAPPEAGPVELRMEVLRAGRGVTQLHGRLLQDGLPCVDAVLTQGTLSTSEAWWSAALEPDLPPEQDCVPMPADAPGTGFRVPLMDVVEQRVDPRGFDSASGASGEVRTWQRLADGRDWDPCSLLVALDPVPPVSYTLGLPGWAPTIQLSAYLRRHPAPGPVRVAMRATEVGDGRMDEIAQVWDSKGRLVAQATQFAAVRMPATAPTHSRVSLAAAGPCRCRLRGPRRWPVPRRPGPSGRCA
jgi:acyl-coenzyme A thioesterase PaaI-like protein